VSGTTAQQTEIGIKIAIEGEKEAAALYSLLPRTAFESSRRTSKERRSSSVLIAWTVSNCTISQKKKKKKTFFSPPLMKCPPAV
jgi:hypothetical protein